MRHPCSRKDVVGGGVVRVSVHLADILKDELGLVSATRKTQDLEPSNR